MDWTGRNDINFEMPTYEVTTKMIKILRACSTKESILIDNILYILFSVVGCPKRRQEQTNLYVLDEVIEVTSI